MSILRCHYYSRYYWFGRTMRRQCNSNDKLTKSLRGWRWQWRRSRRFIFAYGSMLLIPYLECLSSSARSLDFYLYGRTNALKNSHRYSRPGNIGLVLECDVFQDDRPPVSRAKLLSLSEKCPAVFLSIFKILAR